MSERFPEPPIQRSPERQSGMEVLRLLSVFAILAFHANFYALGGPEWSSAPIVSALRTFAEFATLVCVDVFVLISGWFGIRPKAKRILGLWFQCAFFCILLYAVGWVAGIPIGSKREALKNLFWVGKWNWFVKTYVGLYLLSPVLNAFAESASRRVFAQVLGAFFIFQTAFWLFPMSHHDFIQSGFSVFSFTGLYLLARFANLHRPSFATLRRRTDAALFVGIVLLETVIFALGHFVRMPRLSLFAYSSPFAIASSLFLLLFFSKLGIRSAVANALGTSSYAPYLVQTHPSIGATLFYPAVAFAAGKPLAPHWLSRERQIWLIPPDSCGWPMPSIAHFGFVVLVLLAFFLSAILLDRIRILIWNKVLSVSKSSGITI